MPYIGRTLGQGTRSRFLYTATAGQTTFSGSDTQSNTLAYSDNNGLDCFQNGVLLKGGGADYTATSGTSVVLTTGASVSDVIEILVYDVFAIADHVKKSGDAMTGALTNIDVNGTELILDADGDTSITSDTDDQIDFKTGGSDRVTINSSGNVGIGETDISGFGGTYKGLDVAYKGSGLAGRTDNPTFDMRSNVFYDGSNYKYGEGSTSAGILSVGGNQLIFSNAPNGTAGATATITERMRITSDGNVGIGTSSPDNPLVISTGGSLAQLKLARPTDGSNRSIIIFRSSSQGSDVGSVTVTNTSTAFNTSSDYRLKENIVTDWDATTRLKQLKPSRFNFKTHKDTTVDGFLAHEVSGIIPEAITGEKDAVDKEGNPEYQGIDQSKLVPLLTKALQEAVAKIEILEAKVTALEGK